MSSSLNQRGHTDQTVVSSSQAALAWIPPEADPEAKTQVQEVPFIYHAINVKMEIQSK